MSHPKQLGQVWKKLLCTYYIKCFTGCSLIWPHRSIPKQLGQVWSLMQLWILWLNIWQGKRIWSDFDPLMSTTPKTNPSLHLGHGTIGRISMRFVSFHSSYYLSTRKMFASGPSFLISLSHNTEHQPKPFFLLLHGCCSVLTSCMREGMPSTTT